MSEPSVVRRGDVFLAEVSDPRGRKIRKRRPWVVVSPDEVNEAESTVIAVPLTTGEHAYVYRVPCELLGRRGHIVLDQVCTFDVEESRRSIARLGPSTMRTVLSILREMFAE